MDNITNELDLLLQEYMNNSNDIKKQFMAVFFNSCTVSFVQVNFTSRFA